MPTVADSTVFRYLVIVDATDILFRPVWHSPVPPAVVRELQHASPPARVRAWGGTVPAWVDIQAPRLPPRSGAALFSGR
jgi:hypothetical protein